MIDSHQTSLNYSLFYTKKISKTYLLWLNYELIILNKKTQFDFIKI